MSNRLIAWAVGLVVIAVLAANTLFTVIPLLFPKRT